MLNALFLFLPFVSFLTMGICFEALSMQTTKIKNIFLFLFFLPTFILAFFFMRLAWHDAALYVGVPLGSSKLVLSFSIDYLSSILFISVVVIAFCVCLFELLNKSNNLSVFVASLAFLIPFLFSSNHVVAIVFLILFDIVFVIILSNHLKRVINFRALSLFCRFYFLGDFLLFMVTLCAWRFGEFNRILIMKNWWYPSWPVLITVSILCRFLPVMFIQKKIFVSPASLSASVYGVFVFLSTMNGFVFFRLTMNFITEPGYFYSGIILFGIVSLIIVFLCFIETAFVQRIGYVFLMLIVANCSVFLFYQNLLVIWINLFLAVLAFIALTSLSEEEKFILKQPKGMATFHRMNRLTPYFTKFPFAYTGLFTTEILVPFYSNFIFYRFFKIVIGLLNVPFKITGSGNIRRSLFMMVFWAVLFGCLWKVK